MALMIVDRFITPSFIVGLMPGSESFGEHCGQSSNMGMISREELVRIRNNHRLSSLACDIWRHCANAAKYESCRLFVCFPSMNQKWQHQSDKTGNRKQKVGGTED